MTPVGKWESEREREIDRCIEIVGPFIWWHFGFTLIGIARLQWVGPIWDVGRHRMGEWEMQLKCTTTIETIEISHRPSTKGFGVWWNTEKKNTFTHSRTHTGCKFVRWCVGEERGRGERRWMCCCQWWARQLVSLAGHGRTWPHRWASFCAGTKGWFGDTLAHLFTMCAKRIVPDGAPTTHNGRHRHQTTYTTYEKKKTKTSLCRWDPVCHWLPYRCVRLMYNVHSLTRTGANGWMAPNEPMGQWCSHVQCWWWWAERREPTSREKKKKKEEWIEYCVCVP